MAKYFRLHLIFFFFLLLFLHHLPFYYYYYYYYSISSVFLNFSALLEPLRPFFGKIVFSASNFKLASLNSTQFSYFWHHNDNSLVYYMDCFFYYCIFFPYHSPGHVCLCVFLLKLMPIVHFMDEKTEKKSEEKDK